jgi:hypothetical protein
VSVPERLRLGVVALPLEDVPVEVLLVLAVVVDDVGGVAGADPRAASAMTALFAVARTRLAAR